MFLGEFDRNDVDGGGEFAVDAVSTRTRDVVGVMIYRDRGDGIIEVGFTAEYRGLDVQRALADAVDALRWRADQIASAAPATEQYQELIDRHRGHARILEKHAREIAE